MVIKDYKNPNRSDGEQLARFRVLKEGGLSYFARNMDADQTGTRRMYLRKALLKYTGRANMSNDDLDSIRLFEAGNSHIFEDSAGYEFFLQDNKVTDTEAAFRRARAMMPFEFLNLTAKDFDYNLYQDKTTALKAKKMINDFIMKYQHFKEAGMGLYIFSTISGSGKTMLSSCVLNEILKRYHGNTKFVNILDFLEMTKKGFDGNDEDVNAIYQASLLVIDDMGVQMSKEWIDTVLYRMINERYVERLPTIYTSNVPIDHLKINERIRRRIDDTTYLVKLPEESIRKEVRQREKQKLLDEIENGS